ncbi:MAG: hypothetical protein KKF24_01110 [Gammaproteobacteria bacterium]|nr:hypothetical protein [Gammaproteobacteria bacterium]MBU1831270.1 hypothetical protein [Gammaproteobacteria bacterium]
MKGKLFLLGLIAIFSTGCTGTKVLVTPDPESFEAVYNYKYQDLGLRNIPGDKVYAPAGNITESFGTELRTSRFAKNVYYPLRPDDNVDIILESKFDLEMDPHMGSGMVKAFITGFTFFLLEPLFWYDYDYKIVGSVDVYKNGILTHNVSAQTDATTSMKWLSLSKGQTLEGEALGKAKRSLFKQLMIELDKE